MGMESEIGVWWAGRIDPPLPRFPGRSDPHCSDVGVGGALSSSKRLSLLGRGLGTLSRWRGLGQLSVAVALKSQKSRNLRRFQNAWWPGGWLEMVLWAFARKGEPGL